MHERKGDRGARRKTITGTATAFAVVVLLIAVVFLDGGSPSYDSAPSTGSSNVLVPAVLAGATIDLNRSQTSGTYDPEYVSLNNTSTLTRIPVSLTVAVGSCRWVSVENGTEAAIPRSVFHNVEYANETTANASGTVLSHTDGFRVCGGSGVWINYVYWTFSVYQFSAPTLGVNATLTLGGFSDWSGTTLAPPNVSEEIGPSTTAQFIVASNLTFMAILPTPVNGPNSCDYTGQVCSFTQYALVSATDVANTSVAAKIAFSKASGLPVNAAFENWTVGYSSAKVSDNTGVGGFFSDTQSFFNAVFVQFWYLWILLLLVVIVVALATRRKGGRR
ncbi:MAG: hypothetical protein WA691_02865 [Thermoplasmata archaeon]